MSTNVVYMCSFFMTAFTLGFNQETLEETALMEMVIDGLFFLDIVSEFFTTKEIDGVIKEELKPLALSYLQGTFFFDILACLPGLVTLESNPYLYYFKIFRYIQVGRCFAQIDELIVRLKKKYI